MLELLAENVPDSLPFQVRTPLLPDATSVRVRVSVYAPFVASLSGMEGRALLKTLRLVATMSELFVAFLVGSLVSETPPVPGASARTAAGLRAQSYCQSMSAR